MIFDIHWELLKHHITWWKDTQQTDVVIRLFSQVKKCLRRVTFRLRAVLLFVWRCLKVGHCCVNLYKRLFFSSTQCMFNFCYSFRVRPRLWWCFSQMLKMLTLTLCMSSLSAFKHTRTPSFVFKQEVFPCHCRQVLAQREVVWCLGFSLYYCNIKRLVKCCCDFFHINKSKALTDLCDLYSWFGKYFMLNALPDPNFPIYPGFGTALE